LYNNSPSPLFYDRKTFQGKKIFGKVIEMKHTCVCTSGWSKPCEEEELKKSGHMVAKGKTQEGFSG
jgi:hypothetical protein